MDSTCFSSSDPAAERATLVFDFNADEGNLWSRSSQDGPLPLCSTSSPPPASRCLVCLDHAVSAVCRNLTGGVKVMMEAGADQVKISKSECPKLLSDDAHTGQLHGALIFLIVVAVISILLFIIVGVHCGCKHWKRFNRRSNQRAETSTMMPDGGDDIIKADN